jgi:hypothetical protein
MFLLRFELVNRKKKLLFQHLDILARLSSAPQSEIQTNLQTGVGCQERKTLGGWTDVVASERKRQLVRVGRVRSTEKERASRDSAERKLRLPPKLEALCKNKIPIALTQILRFGRNE